MKERPILFSGPMVRAILASTKSQTRRICKPAMAHNLSHVVEVPDPQERGQIYNGTTFGDEEGSIQFTSPYGGVRDRLWVRESHWWFKDECDHETGYYPPALTADDVEYRADGESKRHGWRPSIHMPRWASRITLEITGVRVERLQDINQADAQAEGAPPGHPSIDQISREFGYPDFPRSWYAQLWEEINGPGSWAQNPWVWVVEFKRVQQASSGRPSQLEDAPCSA
ncbi:hypothetical protein ACUTR7_00295 [Delftia sp. NA_296.1]|uniref:hypothetical protein n=1 Tax=Delftia sp. NA_296.1 TaxID=3415648 RepID=UPI004045BAB6